MSAPSAVRRCVSRGSSFHFSSLPVRTRGHLSRSFSNTTHQRAQDDSSNGPPRRSNPILEEYLRNNPTGAASQQQMITPGAPGTAGDLSASSIFEDERRAQQETQAQIEQAERDAAASEVPEMETGLKGRDPQNLRRILDPKPGARLRWERKKVIQMVRKGGRLTKTQFVKRTEREHLTKSHNLKTSVKKLGMLARQIAGKTINDAITQMRFSKKKVAIEVRKQLEFARDEAVVMRGMGLGNVKLEKGDGSADTSLLSDDTSLVPALSTEAERPIDIQLKNGKRHTVTNRSDIYIDQAWVGRGPYGKLPDYRARGRVFIMRTPWTSLTVLLKEETTRIRQYEEREARRRKQKLNNVWVHLPDRPIQTKQQWYSW